MTPTRFDASMFAHPMKIAKRELETECEQTAAVANITLRKRFRMQHDA